MRTPLSDKNFTSGEVGTWQEKKTAKSPGSAPQSFAGKTRALCAVMIVATAFGTAPSRPRVSTLGRLSAGNPRARLISSNGCLTCGVTARRSAMYGSRSRAWLTPLACPGFLPRRRLRFPPPGSQIMLRAPSKRRQCATIGKEDIMPFDGTSYEGRNPALDKMDKVIDLLSDPRRWCQKRLQTPDRRYCIAGAMRAADAVAELKLPILLAIEQVTGHSYARIEDFNDHRVTPHPLVVRVLWQARENIINGAPHAIQQRIGTWALFRQAFANQRELA